MDAAKNGKASVEKAAIDLATKVDEYKASAIAFVTSTKDTAYGKIPTKEEVEAMRLKLKESALVKLLSRSKAAALDLKFSAIAPRNMLKTAWTACGRTLTKAPKQSFGMGIRSVTPFKVESHEVSHIAADSPAAAAGVAPGELIVAVGGVITTGHSHQSLVKLLKAAGDSVTLTLASWRDAV